MLPVLGLLPASRLLLGASLISFADFAQVENKSLFATTCTNSEASNGVIDPPQLATRAGSVLLVGSRTTRMASKRGKKESAHLVAASFR